MRTLPDNAVVVAASESVGSRFDDEFVILNLRDGTYYSLKDVGALVWCTIQEPATLPAICRAVETGYDVDTATCARDVRALLQELLARGLAELASPGA